MASISRVTFANFFQVSQNQSSLSGQERLSPDLESRPPPPTTVRGAAQHTPTMVLEATILCIDNSEYVRNSDYLPTRLQAECDAINLLAGAKTQSNPENSVGVLSLAGKVPRVLVTPTDDLGVVLNAVHSIGMEGTVNFPTGVQVAHLALKHRQNKHQRMRIVLFIGSPVESEVGELVSVGKKLRKCNVAVDVVSFGDVERNAEKLEAFMQAVNKSNNSHLVTVPPGANLADVLLSTPIFMDEDGGGGSGFAAAAAAASSRAAMGGYGGADAIMDGGDDPALALAMRMSLEEERARQEAAAAAAGGEGAADASATPVAAGAADGDPQMMDEDALLQRAFALSMDGEGAGAAGGGDDEGDDPALQAALAMSMNDDAPADADPLADANYVNSILSSLPGVDPNDPSLQAALGNAQNDDDEEEEEK